MFNKDSFIRLIYSIVVALSITLCAMYFTTEYKEVVLIVFKGMMAGIIIWFLGEFFFSLCEKLFPTNILSGYIILFFLILLGTSGFGYIFGIKDIITLLIMSIVAEIFGLGVTFFYRRKLTKDLNEQLLKHKNNLY